ncbi:hypothetical protein [Xanthomonas prunicola]|nr:hypothetical protein [Xanthomonas prunicola]
MSEYLRFYKDIVFIFGLWEWGARSGGSRNQVRRDGQAKALGLSG